MGVELCFYDDNCNGVIDEGCGLHTDLQLASPGRRRTQISISTCTTRAGSSRCGGGDGGRADEG